MILFGILYIYVEIECRENFPMEIFFKGLQHISKGLIFLVCEVAKSINDVLIRWRRVAGLLIILRHQIPPEKEDIQNENNIAAHVCSERDEIPGLICIQEHLRTYPC